MANSLASFFSSAFSFLISFIAVALFGPKAGPCDLRRENSRMIKLDRPSTNQVILPQKIQHIEQECHLNQLASEACQ